MWISLEIWQNPLQWNNQLMIDHDELYKKDPSLKLLDIRIISAKNGEAELTMTVSPKMLNSFGICHGGFIFTLADATFAYACNSHDFDAVAQTCTIEFLRPGKTGMTLSAVAKETYQSGRAGLYDITVSDENNEKIAFFRGKSFRVSSPISKNL